MNFAEKIDFIASRRRFGMMPGLERMERLVEELGHPEHNLLCIHVAGTNGKGSVSAIIASVLQAAGFGSIGRYTSPHLVFFNERICIDGVPASDALLEPALDRILAIVSRLDSEGLYPTFFECVTALAFEVFNKAGVKLAVVETGLGGRLDATNIISPLLSVVTNVGLEHCEYLGDTVEKIAFEKAGIIKNGRPVVAGEMDAAAKKVIASRARELGSPFIDAEASISFRTTKAGKRLLAFESSNRSISSIAFPLLGAYQGENLATAITALETFCEVTALPIDDNAFKTGLESVVWPCRFQVVSDNPTIIVDGAHNPPAARALVSSVAKLECPVALVAGFCDDKDCLEALKCLKPAFHAAWATLTPSPRSLAAAELASRMRIAGFTDPASCDDWHRALEDASKWAAANNGAVVVCGSLFLAGAVANFYNALPWSDGAVIPAELLKPSDGEKR